MTGSVIIIADRKTQEKEVIADLNALFLMVEYVELELERTAPGCVLPASTLRAAIANEIITRATNLEMRLARN